MATIKITQLPPIGNSLAANTVLPVVNVAGTAATDKTTVAAIGNLILTNAGGANFAPAALANLAYSVVNAAQPNITSVGTLPINTLHIGGGTNGQYLQTDGTGNLAWVSGGGTGNGVVGGSNTQIQFNNAGNFGGSSGLTWNGSTGVLSTLNLSVASGATIYGNTALTNLNVAGNLTTNNIFTNNYFYSNGAPFGGISGITVKDEGTNVVASANTINFVGAGVTTSNVGGVATITINGGNGNADTGNVTFDDINIIGTGNLNLQPDPADAAAYVNIYLTGAADIHMAAGAAGANLILGTDEEANVAVLQGGNVAIQAGNVSGTQTWTFDTTGDINIPPNANSSATGRIQSANGYPTLLAYGTGSHGGPELTWADTDDVNDLGNANVLRNTMYINESGLWVGMNENLVANTFAGTWNFTPNGTIIFPTLEVDLHNGGVQPGQVLQFGNSSQQVIITGPTPSANVNAQRIIIQGQRGNGELSEGGDVYVWAGDADTNGGDIKIYAGDADNVSTGSGGYVNIDGGAGFDGGGTIELTGGTSANGTGGYVNMTGGSGETDGGGVNLQGGYSNGTGGTVGIYGGGGTSQASYGAVEIGSGTYAWQFNNSGNLVLPGNTFAVNYANGTQVSIGGGANTGNVTFSDQVVMGTGSNDGTGGLYLAPGNASIANSAVQYLRVRGGDVATHIHLDTGDNGYFDQYFGDDGKYVKLESGGNISIGTNTHNWTFGLDSNLAIPGNIVGPANANVTIYSNAGVHEFTFGDDGTFYAPDNVVLGGTSVTIGPGANSLTGFGNAVLVASSNSEAYVQAVITNVSDVGSADWVAYGHHGTDAGGWADIGFTSSGFNDANFTITKPGSGYVFAHGFDIATQPVVAGDGSLVLATGEQGNVKDIIFATGGFLEANEFMRISDANNALELNRANSSIAFKGGTDGNINTVGNIKVIANSNIWTFGTTGNLTLPANTVAINFANGSSAFGNIVATNLDGSSSNVLYGNGTFAAVPAPTVSQDITSNGAMSIMLYDGNIKYNNYATVEPSTGNIAGGNISTTGQITSTKAGNLSTGGGQLYLNGSGNNRIDFNTNGTGAPSFTTRSAGAKVVLYPSIGASATDYAMGVDAGTLWSGIPAADGGQFFKWYGGTTEVANLSGTGMLTVTGNITGGNLIGPHANGNSNINMPAANGNINMSVAGNANIVVVTGTGANITGNLSVSGNIAGNNISATGNISGNTNGFTIGYLNIPQVAAANATLALTDAGKHYYSTTAGNFTLTVPNNATTAFATGTAISIVVQAAGNILVNADTGVTLYMAGNSTAANRVVGGYGMATLMKVASDTWFINGTGVS